MLAPGTTIDRYVVEAPLGEGGMAQVYRVRHAALGTLHALKVLTLTRDDVRSRFLQEGRLQATLRHPNIVAVTDVLQFEGQTALLLEFVDGPTLSGWLRDAPRDLAVVERLFREIVAGVAFAHEKGLVHRDLKPANVLLARTDDGWTAKVADFGLAKVAGDASASATRSNIAMGTPSYMAPEQIRNAKHVDARADVYGLGCILYEMLCRRPPYQGDDLVDLLQQVVGGEYPAPETFAAGLPPRFSATIRECLRVNPDRRPPDCRTLLAVLTTGERPPDDARPTEPLLPPVPVTLVAPSDAPASHPAPAPGPAPVPADSVGRASVPAESVGRASVPAVPAQSTLPPSDPPPAPTPKPAAARGVFAGLTVAAVAGLIGVVVVGLGVVTGIALYYVVGEEPPAATIATAPAEPGLRACVPGGEARVGWVRVDQRSFNYSTTWESGKPRLVFAELPTKENGWNEGAEPVCELPPGAIVRLSEKHEISRAWWIALDGDAFTTDGSAPPALPVEEKRPSGSSGSSTKPPRTTQTDPAPAPDSKKPRPTERGDNPLDDIEETLEKIDELGDRIPDVGGRRRVAEEGG